MLSQLFIGAFLVGVALGQSDLTRVSGAKGEDVVEATLASLGDTCIFRNDHLFLRRLAYVVSRDGTDPKTYRQGFHGGIWQVDEASFKATKSSSLLKQHRADIKTALGIDWDLAQWADLRKPLYSGIAAIMNLTRIPAADIGSQLTEQGVFFQEYFAQGNIAAYNNFVNLTQDLDADCVIDNLDVAFLVDASVSVSGTDFQEAMDFVSTTASGYSIGLDSVRVALVTYSTGYKTFFDFDDHHTLADVQKAIQAVVKVDGATDTDKALKYANDVLFTSQSGSRDTAAHMIVLLTDGESNDLEQTAINAQALKDRGVVIFAIGIGHVTLEEDLHAMASHPLCTHAQRLQHYSDLDTIRAEIRQASCDASSVLGKGNHSIPCDRRNILGIMDANETSITIRPKQGSVRVFGSYSVARPNGAAHDFDVAATASRPVVIFSKNNNDRLNLVIEPNTLLPGQCITKVEIDIVSGNALKKYTTNVCITKGIVQQCTVPTTTTPTQGPTTQPSASVTPTVQPTATGTATIQSLVSTIPTIQTSASSTLTKQPSASTSPTIQPSVTTVPTIQPSVTAVPTIQPSVTAVPTIQPSVTAVPTIQPSVTAVPTIQPSVTAVPTILSSVTAVPTIQPSATAVPTIQPSATAVPTIQPSVTAVPTIQPSVTAVPTIQPSATAVPTLQPSASTTLTMQPSASTSPTIHPPTTELPTTELPTTEPPTTEPPTTQPPTTEPPTTQPPTTQPPTTEPPTTELPTTTETIPLVGGVCALCTEDSLKQGNHLFPYVQDPTKYIECTQHVGVCFIKDCAPNYTWRQVDEACVSTKATNLLTRLLLS